MAILRSLSYNLTNLITQANATEKARGEVPNLVVSVISNEVTLPSDPNDFPQYAEDVQVHPEATTARDGNGRGENTGLTNEDQT